MSETITPRSAAFFFERAGYSAPAGADADTIRKCREASANQLAEAHELLAEAVDAGAARVEWTYDADADPDDDAGTREAFEAGVVEPYSCAILTRCNCCGSFTAAASLAGIWLSTSGVGKDPYCDVIEAELALEAAQELRARLDAGDPDPEPDDETYCHGCHRDYEPDDPDPARCFNCGRPRGWRPGDDPDPEPLVVRVTLINDLGITGVVHASGATTDEAIALAERQARETTGDDSWTMSDWAAA